MSSTDPVAPKPGQRIELTIEKIAAGGHGMAHFGDVPVFVLGAIPGQKVEVVITRGKDRFAEAKVVKILKPSMDEIKPRCKHFWDCGGCVGQHVSY